MINCMVYDSVRRCLLVWKLKRITLFVCTSQGRHICVYYSNIVGRAYQRWKGYRSIRLSSFCVQSDVIRACDAWIFIVCSTRQESNTSTIMARVQQAIFISKSQLDHFHILNITFAPTNSKKIILGVPLMADFNFFQRLYKHLFLPSLPTSSVHKFTSSTSAIYKTHQ